MLPGLAAIAVPVGTAITSVLSYFFRFAVVTFLVKAAFVALVALSGYLLADILLPEWFSIQNLVTSLSNLHPSVLYFAEMFEAIFALKLFTSCLTFAWIFKKLPSFAFLGPLLRGIT